jgi:hypothetical protein
LRPARGVHRPPGHVPAGHQAPCRNHIWGNYLWKQGRGCYSRGSLCPGPGLAGGPGFGPARQAGGERRCSPQSGAARFGLIDRSVSERRARKIVVAISMALAHNTHPYQPKPTRTLRRAPESFFLACRRPLPPPPTEPARDSLCVQHPQQFHNKIGHTKPLQSICN